MRHRTSRAAMWQITLGLLGYLFTSACGSTGCEGCNPAPIPGGFNHEHRFDNAMQVRLSKSGITFIEDNFNKLVEFVMPGGLSMDIPEMCNSTPQICCNAGPCTADVVVEEVQLTPVLPSRLKLNLRATVTTNFFPVSIVGLTCNFKYDSTESGLSTVGLNADIDFVVQANNNNKLKVVRTGGSIDDLDCNDLKSEGGFCSLATLLCPLFESTLETILLGFVDSTIDGLLEQLPMGQEGRFNMGDLYSKYSPRTTGLMDYLIWAGGYAETEQEGMSIGVMGGFRAVEPHACVPDCELPGASCKAPVMSAIPRYQTFRGNTRPDTLAYDVGIGIDRRTIEQAVYNMFRSGGLCLDLTSHTISMLTTDFLNLIVPSLKTLTRGATLPLMISIRPNHPPTVTLGKGYYHMEGENVVIDDPLITVKAKDLAIDIYVQLDERMIRLFTLMTDLNIPMLLFADGEGRLQPMLGDLTEAFTNLEVTNSDLLTESPEELAKLFPSIIQLVAGFLANGFSPIELPSIQGLRLVLDGGSITSTDNNEVLAIFAKLGILQPTSWTDPDARVDTEAGMESFWMPRPEAFKLSPEYNPARGPAVTLNLGAQVPAALAGEPLEFAYRVDGGFYHPWTSAERITVRDPLFWLQGKHTVEVMARVKGDSRTLDLTPAMVEVVVDTLPPKVMLISGADGVRAVVHDGVLPAEDLELSWRIDDGSYCPFGNKTSVEVPPGISVAVRVRDRAGNIGASQTISQAIKGEAQTQGGCQMAGGEARGLSVWLWALALLALLRRGRAKRGNCIRVR